jgi:hypothetical protein
MIRTPAQDPGREKTSRSRMPIPAAPLTGLLDNGNIFNGDDRGLVEAAIKDFETRTGLPVYVATENYLTGEKVDEYGERLTAAWLKGKPGLVLLYERAEGKLNYSASPGSLGKDADPRALFLHGSRASATMPKDASDALCLRAAIEAMTAAGEVWKKTGIVPAAESTPPPVPLKPDSANKPPVDFVIDQAEVFDLDEEVSLKTTLVKFNGSNDMDIYVLTYPALQLNAQEHAENLARTWLADRFGAVVVYDAGTQGPASVGIANSDRNESLIPPAVLMKAAATARERARETAPPGSPAKALRSAVDILLEVFLTHAVPVREETAHATSPNQWRVLSAVATILVFGCALLFIFHRFQERVESRANEQLFFPDVTVDRRLGSPQGGGLVAGISFAKDPGA